jgi:hypothetical protein
MPKISALPITTEPDNVSDYIPLVQSGVTKRITPRNFKVPVWIRATAPNGFAIANNTDTAYNWTDAVVQSNYTGGWASGQPTRFVVPTGYGQARLTGNVQFPSNATGYRSIKFLKNGGVFDGMAWLTVPAISGAAHSLNIATGLVAVNAGDYFEMVVYQNSGGALNTPAPPFSQMTNFTMELF